MSLLKIDEESIARERALIIFSNHLACSDLLLLATMYMHTYAKGDRINQFLYIRPRRSTSTRRKSCNI